MQTRDCTKRTQIIIVTKISLNLQFYIVEHQLMEQSLYDFKTSKFKTATLYCSDLVPLAVTQPVIDRKI